MTIKQASQRAKKETSVKHSMRKSIPKETQIQKVNCIRSFRFHVCVSVLCSMVSLAIAAKFSIWLILLINYVVIFTYHDIYFYIHRHCLEVYARNKYKKQFKLNEIYTECIVYT